MGNGLLGVWGMMNLVRVYVNRENKLEKRFLMAGLFWKI